MGAASIMYSSEQQPVRASNQQTRTLRKSNSTLVSKPSGKFSPTTRRVDIHGGHILGPPPFMSFSYPPSHSPSLYNYLITQEHQYINNYYGHQKPPLLPSPNISITPSLTRGISCPPPSTKKTKPKKQKTFKKKDHPNPNCFVGSKDIPSGPDPNELTVNFPKVLSLAPKAKSYGATNSASLTEKDKFSGSVFAASPPPSSLPLPKFTVKPKRACKAEAAARVNDGAADNVRRMLHL